MDEDNQDAINLGGGRFSHRFTAGAEANVHWHNGHFPLRSENEHYNSGSGSGRIVRIRERKLPLHVHWCLGIVVLIQWLHTAESQLGMPTLDPPPPNARLIGYADMEDSTVSWIVTTKWVSLFSYSVMQEACSNTNLRMFLFAAYRISNPELIGDIVVQCIGSRIPILVAIQSMAPVYVLNNNKCKYRSPLLLNATSMWYLMPNWFDMAVPIVTIEVLNKSSVQQRYLGFYSNIVATVNATTTRAPGEGIGLDCRGTNWYDHALGRGSTPQIAISKSMYGSPLGRCKRFTTTMDTPTGSCKTCVGPKRCEALKGPFTIPTCQPPNFATVDYEYNIYLRIVVRLIKGLWYIAVGQLDNIYPYVYQLANSITLDYVVLAILAIRLSNLFQSWILTIPIMFVVSNVYYAMVRMMNFST